MLVVVTYDDMNTETFESCRRLRNEAKMGSNLDQHVQKSVLSGGSPSMGGPSPKSDVKI